MSPRVTKMLTGCFERQGYRQPTGLGRPPQADLTPAKAERARPQGLLSRRRVGGVVTFHSCDRTESVARRNPKGDGSPSPTSTTTMSSPYGAAPATVSG